MGVRLKFCASVYMSILKAFKIPAASQVEIGNELLSAVTGEDFVRYDDAQISDLFHGKKNMGEPVISAARHLDNDAYIQRFEDSVMSLIDANELPSVVAAMRSAIADDDHIRQHTVVEPIGRITKHEIVRCSSFNATEFLAGIFLYVVVNVENKGTQKYAKNVDVSFVDGARVESDGITLAESPGGISAESRTLWRNGPNSVSVVAGDIFNSGIYESFSDRALVAISVDSSFSTVLASGVEGGNPFLVSPKTIHGKFLRSMYCRGITDSDLDRRIENELRLAGYQRDVKGHFPIGSIAVIDDGNVSYCLLAVAEHDERGNTQSTETDIRSAVNNLVLLYDRRGLGYPLLIPLLGTGRSRSGMDQQRSFELLLRCLMENKQRIQGDVIIVALPEVFHEVNIEKAVSDCGV